MYMLGTTHEQLHQGDKMQVSIIFLLILIMIFLTNFNNDFFYIGGGA